MSPELSEYRWNEVIPQHIYQQLLTLNLGRNGLMRGTLILREQVKATVVLLKDDVEEVLSWGIMYQDPIHYSAQFYTSPQHRGHGYFKQILSWMSRNRKTVKVYYPLSSNITKKTRRANLRTKKYTLLEEYYYSAYY